MFATKQTTIVPEIHGKQDATGVNLGQVPNLELESGTTGAPGHIIQQEYIEYTTLHEFTTNTPTTISGFSKAITLRKSNSRVPPKARPITVSGEPIKDSVSLLPSLLTLVVLFKL